MALRCHCAYVATIGSTPLTPVDDSFLLLLVAAVCCANLHQSTPSQERAACDTDGRCQAGFCPASTT